ncbi:hypothetical protein R1sor_021330 [Riccia sorocarpa]|uniref:Retroviral polymerase SH3-like domain-containing protein n=1 Tax=Riccia sorocarpa TaxID=122646 RepID=A0ABD3GIX5_9MARC
MILEGGLPAYLWGEVITAATYLTNRSPTKSNSGLTPEEKYTGKPPDLSHLRVYRCVAYVHLDSCKTTKLDSRTTKCILVGDLGTGKLRGGVHNTRVAKSHAR